MRNSSRMSVSLSFIANPNLTFNLANFFLQQLCQLNVDTIKIMRYPT